MPDDDFIPEVIEVPITDELDLHTFRPSELGDLLDDYLAEALAAGYTSVRIIHGKGSGQLRNSVAAILSRHRLVTGFRLQPNNPGATLAELAEPET